MNAINQAKALHNQREKTYRSQCQVGKELKDMGLDTYHARLVMSGRIDRVMT
ncbi:MAG: hypothetical protein LBI19_07855 [Oscillospiraceae bacterium]|jgi:hypothetical protein|nr:hypothetical protein [Oscillospiraceae bacterium]